MIYKAKYLKNRNCLNNKNHNQNLLKELIPLINKLLK